MSLKAELETWAAALKAYDEQDYEKALDYFSRIADTSKILTNIGLIYATIGQHELAVDNYNAACTLDRYLAVAYFQCGVSNFVLRRFELAYKDFAEAETHLRENQAIEYEQLGLKFKLWLAEVLFNKGLCRIYMGDPVDGLRILDAARKQKATPEHDVIDDALADRGEGYNVFSIPAGVIYRPSESKLKNAKTKDYLGKAKLVAAADAKDAYTTFVGVTRLQQGQTPSGAPLPGSTLLRSNTRARDPDPDTTTNINRSRTVVVTPSRDRANTTPELVGSGLSKSASAAVTKLERNRSGSAAGLGLNIGDGGATGRNSGGSSGSTTSSSAQPLPAGVVKGLTIRRPSGDRINAPARAGDFGRRPSESTEDLLSGGRRVPSPLGGDRARRTPENQYASPQQKGGRLGMPPARPRTTDDRGVTQFYDDYLDTYGVTGESVPVPELPPLNVGGNGRGEMDRVAAWANKTFAGASPSLLPSRAPSTRGANNGVGNNAALRRQLSRRPTYNGNGRSVMSKYGDEDDGGFGGGGSGDYDDLIFDLVKIRVKLHYDDEVRGMALSPDIPFQDFVEKVNGKFGKRYGGLVMKFKDEDGGKVSLKDEMDYEMAIETARESAQGRPEGKLEIWLMDV